MVFFWDLGLSIAPISDIEPCGEGRAVPNLSVLGEYIVSLLYETELAPAPIAGVK